MHFSTGKSQSQQNLTKAATDSRRPPGGNAAHQGQYRGQGQGQKSDKVPRVEVEEIEQEILARDETIQVNINFLPFQESHILFH